MVTRNFTELEIVGARHVLKKLFPHDEFFYCDDSLCSTHTANIGRTKDMAVSWVDITENGVLIVWFENTNEELQSYIVRDIHDTPKLVKTGE